MASKRRAQNTAPPKRRKPKNRGPSSSSSDLEKDSNPWTYEVWRGLAEEHRDAMSPPGMDAFLRGLLGDIVWSFDRDEVERLLQDFGFPTYEGMPWHEPVWDGEKFESRETKLRAELDNLLRSEKSPFKILGDNFQLWSPDQARFGLLQAGAVIAWLHKSLSTLLRDLPVSDPKRPSEQELIRRRIHHATIVLRGLALAIAYEDSAGFSALSVSARKYIKEEKLSSSDEEPRYEVSASSTGVIREERADALRRLAQALTYQLRNELEALRQDVSRTTSDIQSLLARRAAVVFWEGLRPGNNPLEPVLRLTSVDVEQAVWPTVGLWFHGEPPQAYQNDPTMSDRAFQENVKQWGLVISKLESSFASNMKNAPLEKWGDLDNAELLIKWGFIALGHNAKEAESLWDFAAKEAKRTSGQPRKRPRRS